MHFKWYHPNPARLHKEPHGTHDQLLYLVAKLEDAPPRDPSEASIAFGLELRAPASDFDLVRLFEKL